MVYGLLNTATLLESLVNKYKIVIFSTTRHLTISTDLIKILIEKTNKFSILNKVRIF